MDYSKSILPTQAGYWELVNATIIGEKLSVRRGGYARCYIYGTNIAKLTETFQVNLLPTKPTDSYQPQVQVEIDISTKESNYQYVVFPVTTSSGILSTIVKAEAGDYESFSFTVRAAEDVEFTLWELCPEAVDEDIKVIIDGIEQSLPRLLFDYNTWPLQVYKDETAIALITFNLKDNTDLQGHLELTYVASTDCTVTLRFKDNGSTELFSPILYDIHAGRGSIGVPHSYLHRLKGIHTIHVTAQITEGTLTLGTRGVLFTIDGGYLAERLLDIGADIRDVALRQIETVDGPDEIWVVGIEAGEGIIRKRAYKEENVLVAFTPVFSLGQILEAGIEFDGNWVLRAEAERYTIDTEEVPWVFWTDKKKVLWAQKGQDKTTLIQLDTNVAQLSVCKGYSSQDYLEQDQGLVCAYLKNGIVYYRSLILDLGTGLKRWDKVYTISEYTNVEYVQVHRLNDYRLGFAITTGTDNFWLITKRTYVAQAGRPENLSIFGQLRQYGGYANKDTPLWPEFIQGATTVLEDRKTFIWDSGLAIRKEAYDWGEAFIWPANVDYYEDVESVVIEGTKCIITFKVQKGTISLIPKPYALAVYLPDVGWYPVPTTAWVFQVIINVEGAKENLSWQGRSTLNAVYSEKETKRADGAQEHLEVIGSAQVDATYIEIITQRKSGASEHLNIVGNASVTAAYLELGYDPV